MLTLVMNKIATIIRETGKRGLITSHKYADLDAALAGEKLITVSYCFGQAKHRVKQLEALGFTLKEVIWRNEDAPHGNIREVWGR